VPLPKHDAKIQNNLKMNDILSVILCFLSKKAEKGLYTRTFWGYKTRKVQKCFSNILSIETKSLSLHHKSNTNAIKVQYKLLRIWRQ